jgi:DNA-binding response OmpR family regulator
MNLQSSVTSESARPCVLVVDDDPDTRWMTAQALRRDCDVVGSASLAEALARARERRPATILVDLQLGAESGWDLVRSLQADRALSVVPIVILSGNTSRTVPSDLQPCAAYLRKPCRMSELRQVVAGLCGSS